jgi:hypothetical protein
VGGGGGGGAGSDPFADVSDDAKARLVLLSKVLDHVLSESYSHTSDPSRALMVFVHVRTGSSLSASAVHPEMWGVLRHLGDYAASRFQRGGGNSSNDDGGGAGGAGAGGGLSDGSEFEWLASVCPPGIGAAPRPGGNALVVALTHRRVLDCGSAATSPASTAYAYVDANADRCDGLLQLDPLNQKDREAYLCLSLRVAKVPAEVNAWVSSVANGNPQYIEICAALVDTPAIMERVEAVARAPGEVRMVLMRLVAQHPTLSFALFFVAVLALSLPFCFFCSISFHPSSTASPSFPFRGSSLAPWTPLPATLQPCW